jgi:hypothetical protein
MLGCHYLLLTSAQSLCGVWCWITYPLATGHVGMCYPGCYAVSCSVMFRSGYAASHDWQKWELALRAMRFQIVSFAL